MDASSAPAGRSESETNGSSQGGAVGASSAPAGRAKNGTRGSSQEGAVDAPSGPARRADSDPSAASTPDTDQGDGEDTRALLSRRAAHEHSNWGQLPATVRGRTRGQSQRMGGEPGQYKMNPEVGDVLLAAAYEWMKSGSRKERTSWRTEDALDMMAGGSAETKRELSVSMPSCFPADVEPPPQSIADVERSKYKAAWHEAIKIELDGDKTTGTYYTKPQRRRKGGNQ